MPIIDGTTYSNDTPKEVIDILERARRLKWRLRIHLGDPKTGKPWGDIETGYIGRSCGSIKIPLVIYNTRTTGGPGLLDRCIICIEHANKKSGGVLFDCRREDGKEGQS
jgi:hypothetical protein